MSWERWRADNLAGWEDRVPIHAGPGGYDVAGLLADPKRLSATVRHDRESLGSLAGLDLVHLQCHLGTDTLSLLRLGAASVSGLDFSPRAIAHCRSLFERAGVAGRFVEGDVFDAERLLGGARFDLVYASIGAINWIPSIGRWLAVAAGLLKPGGRLYLRDVHPMAMAIDPGSDLELRLRFPYGEQPLPVTLHDDQTYSGDGTPLANSTSHEWSHSLGEIVEGALAAGLVVSGLAEHYYTEWRMLESMVKDADDRWLLPEAPERLPLLFTLQATKPG
ncbi:MAG: class I SAM-dependent methyltransferase [Burkholderiales bacterium]|nr:class I SAM-dependent methyltransferase [Burkholderiales bacterium]